MAELNGNHSLDIESIVKSVLPQERLTSMEFRELETSEKCMYSFRLQSTGERGGYSEIYIQQVNGEVTLQDYIKLPIENQGFEVEVSRAKGFMFYDLGATTPKGGVRELEVHPERSKGHVLTFKVNTEKAKPALWHYLETVEEVMEDFFKGEICSLDLYLSMIRSRTLPTS